MWCGMYVLSLVWIVDRGGGGEERVTTLERKEITVSGRERESQIEQRRQKEEKNMQD